MDVVREAGRLALKSNPRAARHVELDGDGFVTHQAIDTAQLVE